MLFPFLSLSRSIYMYMLFQRCTCDLAILHEPELLLRIPPSACCFRLEPHRHVGGFDAQRNKGIRSVSRRRRRPFSPLDNQFDGFQPLPRFSIIPETNTKQGIAVLFRQTFRSPLPNLRAWNHMEQTSNNLDVLSALLFVSASFVAVPFFM